VFGGVLWRTTVGRYTPNAPGGARSDCFHTDAKSPFNERHRVRSAENPFNERHRGGSAEDLFNEKGGGTGDW
jgi:hypothetical protein